MVPSWRLLRLVIVASAMVALRVVTAAAQAASSEQECQADEDASSSSLRDDCRRFPTWRPHPSAEHVNVDACSKASGYDPERSDVITGADDVFTEYGDEWAKNILDCLVRAESKRCENGSPACAIMEEPLRSPKITGLYPSPDQPIMATVDFALSEFEAAVVQDLAACVGQYHPHLFEQRAFDYSEESEGAEGGGGNDVTYLAGFLQIFAPAVVAQIRDVAHLVWKTAGWENVTHDGYYREVEYSDPRGSSIGIRTTEHLSYEKWGKLAKHSDSESLYTILVALADPTEYEGGSFYIDPARLWKSGFKISLKPQRLSAIVFISEEEHGVEEILKGKREMFTTELWAYPDVTVGVRRPYISDYHRFLERGHWWLDEGEEYEGGIM